LLRRSTFRKPQSPFYIDQNSRNLIVVVLGFNKIKEIFSVEIALPDFFLSLGWMDIVENKTFP